MNLVGLSFILDGVDLTPELTLNELMEITQRDITLRGVLADGSAFSFDLNSVSRYEDSFSPYSTLTITLVPEPGTLGLIGIGALGILRRRRIN